MKKPQNKQKVFILSLINFLVIIFFIVVYYLPEKWSLAGWKDFLHRIERVSLNLRYGIFAARGGSLTAEGMAQRQATQSEFYRLIYLVSVDEESIKEYKSYPLPSSVWISVLDHFLQQEPTRRPRSLFFNIPFYEKPDPQFAKKLEGYPIPIGMDFRLEDTGEYPDYESDDAQAMKAFEIPFPYPEVLSHYSSYIAPPSDYTRNTTYLGYLNLEGEEDVMYKVPLFASVTYKKGDTLTNVVYPSAVLMMVLAYTGVRPETVKILPNKVILPQAQLKEKTMDIVIPVDKHYRMRIHYKSQGQYQYLRNISLKDIFRAGLPRQTLLIFGVRSEGTAANKFASPMGSMFSADHLAYGVGTILNREFLSDVPWWIELVIIISWLIILQIMILRGLKTTIFALVLALLLPLGIGITLFKFGWIFATFLPLIAGIFYLIVGEVYILITEEREKRLIKNTFSRYVSPDLVNILVEDPSLVQLGGVEREVTMLFSDIRGFTTLSEGMKPTELIEFLNVYLSQMTDIVLETRGSLDKYIGDAIVAFWGAPLPLEDHALQACTAAVRMVEKLKEFNANLIREGKQPINIGIGLNTGVITVGNIGSQKKKNYTAIGEPMILTEELQDENKTYKTNIIMSEFTYQKVKDKVIVRELDLYPYLDRYVRIYELLGIV
ncbi:adenylate/guanylate cyclase domain-containing protein [Thermospira aquatica]|uniref:Adenylate/guanylate cyclase domain-containing protein n=1 Tax=Thermospira aquatica TaxID=2828656 RepID=A0AAX3BC59_9SPIR|nr:adenylate/guanylate cyclase domain-containing protein [Thermospira aquatica]URA09869.1 adenylate/guanylate cyclase domain-containing protein [Thermospira aquatica]